MSFVSYAQNFEDVMLWRALKHVEHGFYIDVGANDPIEHSVTKAFYEHGWTGINIEPEQELYDLLVVDRANDINLNIAISDSDKVIDFFVSNIRGWSTTDKESLANLKQKQSFSETRVVPAMTLDEVCEQHAVRDIHFLKIDVEGAEKNVLQSFAFRQRRPWIVVVEATKPTTQVDVSANWQDILFEHNYMFSYFDGLNKYYVANEHAGLAAAFVTPPNIFDKFQHIRQINSDANAAHWQVQAAQKQAQIRVTETLLSEAEAKVLAADAKSIAAATQAQMAESKARDALQQYQLIITSRTWRLTKPLRYGLAAFRRWLTVRPGAMLRALLFRLRFMLERHETVKVKVYFLLSKTPKLKRALHGFIYRCQATPVKKEKHDDVFLLALKQEIEARKQSLEGECQ